MNLIAAMMLAVAPDAQASPDVVLLDFTAGYCEPCQRMAPVLQRMKAAGFPIQVVDITKQPAVSRKHNVERIPTFVLLVEGKEVQRFQGITDESELRRAMNDVARKLDMQRRREANDTEDIRRRSEADKNNTQANTDTPRPGIRGMFDRIKNGFSGDGGNKEELERPDFRAQSPEPKAANSTNDSKAMRATVRIRLDDGKFQDVGTGTIVHSEKGQSTILTCAHMFKEVSGEAAVVVDVFRNGDTLRYPATVLGGSHDSDLAFLQIKTRSPLPKVPLATNLPQTNAPIFSIGCNGGNMPTTLKTTLVELNRFEGPENILTAIDPVQGRSGGGLYNKSGELIGVCSGAFRERKEGLYTGIGAVRQLANKLKLTALFDNDANPFMESPEADVNTIAATENPFANDALLNEVFDGDAPAFEPNMESPPTMTASSTTGTQLPDPFTQAPTAITYAASKGSEITVIIDSKEKGKQVIVIPRASPWLVELLTGEPAAAANNVALEGRTNLSTTSNRRTTRKLAIGQSLPPVR